MRKERIVTIITVKNGHPYVQFVYMPTPPPHFTDVRGQREYPLSAYLLLYPHMNGHVQCNYHSQASGAWEIISEVSVVAYALHDVDTRVCVHNPNQPLCDICLEMYHE
jgi:hypothetical protein